MTTLTTPFLEQHKRAGAKLIEFAGFLMPVSYAGILSEHTAVRTSAGVFDVSHMGEVLVEGKGALALLQRLTPNDVAKLVPGRIHYSSLLTERGTFVDDVLVYRREGDRFLVVVNASNVEKDFAWMQAQKARLSSQLPGTVELRDVSEQTALIALQGPNALAVLESAWEGALAPGALKYYGFFEGGRVGGAPVRIVSRTGYTGEDGFELYCDPVEAPRIWDGILATGRVKPAGLGARDTLRLEAAMCLYGHEIDDATTPLEAGLDWTVKLEKGEFLGRDVLARQAAEGTKRRLVGLEVTGRGIARQGHEVLAGGRAVGRVTSGTQSPTLGRPVALAHVEAASSAVGSELEVDVRGRRVAARVVPLPFYSRKRNLS